MFLTDWLWGQLPAQAYRHWVEASILLAGSLLVLCAAELLGCHAFCGLATAIYIVLIVSHFESGVPVLLHESDSDDSCRSYCMVYQCKASSLSACSRSVSGWIMRA